MEVFIGKEIRKVLNQRGMSRTSFADQIHRSRESAKSILNRPSINTELLCTISKVLDFDFFRLYSEQLMAPNDPKE